MMLCTATQPKSGGRGDGFATIRRPGARLACALVMILAGGMLSGCNLLGAAAVVGYKVAGPPKVDAKYVPARTPMLVLVENYEHQSTTSLQSDLLSRTLAQQIQVHDIAPVINPAQLQALRDSRGDAYSKMSITEIARELGAAQVLYVQLETADASPLSGGEGYTGSARAKIKLVDATSGNTLWPKNEQQYPVAAQTQIDSAHGAADPLSVRRQLYDQLADQVSKLFYAWQPEDMSPGTYEQ
jgi:hypothetical protein